jgi:D-sedoheptulose 7-phosphate isomerase
MNPSRELLQQRAQDHLLGTVETGRRVLDGGMEAILAAAELIVATLQSGGKLLLCGNGGSAADCQHLATEFVSRLSRNFERRALPAIALTTDTSILTAVGNDCGFHLVFRRQVEALARTGDLLIGISTSGGSENVIQAFLAAQAIPVRTVALTGNSGRLAEIADAAISVPSANLQHVQEMHLAIEHILCDLVECSLFADIHPSLEQRP